MHPWFPECCWKGTWSKCDLNVARRSWRKQASGLFLAFRFCVSLIFTWSEILVTQVTNCGQDTRSHGKWLDLITLHYLCSPAAPPKPQHCSDFFLDFSVEFVSSVSAARLPAPPSFSLARCPSFSGWCLFRHFQAFNVIQNISQSF